MHSKKVALALLASALLSTTAFAQSSPPPAAKSTPSATQPTHSSSAQPGTMQSGEWRASKLVGLNVYNANNDKIGDINELITDSSGKIKTIVVGVGGFLGMGEHRVGLAFDQVKFVNEPVKSSSTTSSSTARPASTTGTATTTTTTSSSNSKDYPDHAMVSMTKDQLKALPAFKYASDTSSSSTGTTTTTPAREPARAPATPPAAPAPAPSK